MCKIIEWRGTDIALTEKKKLIYDVFIREERILGWSEKLTEDYCEGE